jgi:hypothetical protein
MSVGNYVDLQTASNPSLPKTTGVAKTYSVAFSSKNNKKQPLVGIKTTYTYFGGKNWKNCHDTTIVGNYCVNENCCGFTYQRVCYPCYKGEFPSDITICDTLANTRSIYQTLQCYYD